MRATRTVPLAALTAVVAAVAAVLPAQDWAPVPGPLATRWAKDVRPERVWPEYPRPQLMRDEWLNLNGLWRLHVGKAAAGPPAAAEQYEHAILVPFPIESSLSGVARAVAADERVWYRRAFDVPEAWIGRRVRLHFGAVDFAAEVFVDGRQVGEHRGGYDPFWFEIAHALRARGPHELVVGVRDPTDGGTQPRGKQVRRPEGIWYTASTGIWQTVWLEPLPAASIDRLALGSDGAGGHLTVRATGTALEGKRVRARVLVAGAVAAASEGEAGAPLVVAIRDPRPWSPDDPFLYDVEAELVQAGRVLDRVRSYAGLRTIAVGPDDAGVPRLLLNGAPLFQHGLLDQGFWPDGLYTAPSDEALRFDLEVAKRLGFNALRKHVKVEPQRWYWWCDRLGLLVWQDMPSGDRSIGARDQDLERAPESARQFELELGRLVDALESHPCVAVWVPFNEGWGQFDTARIAGWLAQRDPSRPVDSASGWTDRGAGQVHDVHAYPGPGMPALESARAAVLGEYGGLGLPLPGHTWVERGGWGYRSLDSSAALTDAYVALARRLRPLLGQGLAAAVYTQLSDVETEVNGLLTYDRAVLKVDAERVRAANLDLYRPPPSVRTLAPTAREARSIWRYTMAPPPVGWKAPGFDDVAWPEGAGGFGTEGTPGAVVGTEWSGPAIWLRRTFDLPDDVAADSVHLCVHHDEDAEVFVNGTEIAALAGYTTDYVLEPLGVEARVALRPGQNTLAVHCRQTTGGQFIDAGLVEVIERRQ